ncbi:MAG: hypothetical protein P0Y51_21725 [Candidatus Pseudomonas colombiensis]|jgi:hypothetical protein|nr:MAG: hypothetical protein P0Y51_21725 [Pseudomonas sp.]
MAAALITLIGQAEYSHAVTPAIILGAIAWLTVVTLRNRKD